MDTVAEAVAYALRQSHDPIDHSSRFDQEWLKLSTSERVQIMRDRIDNGLEALSGEPLPDTEIRDAKKRKRYTAITKSRVRKRATGKNRVKNKGTGQTT